MNSSRLEEILITLGSEKAEHILKYLTPEQIIELFESVDLDALARDDFNLEPEEDHKVFNTYLADSMFIQPFQLYGKYGEIIESRPDFQEATIYFIAKRRQLRFCLEETELEKDYLRFSISVAGQERVAHKISIPRLFTGRDMPEIKELLFVPVVNFFHFDMLRSQRRNYPITGILLNKEKSNGKTLVFNIFRPDGGVEERDTFPHILMDLSEMNSDDFSEVLYIGQSRKMRQRTISHEKIQRALAEVKDGDEIYVYFFSIKQKRILWGAENSLRKLGIIFMLGSTHETFDDVVEITDEGNLNLIEMTLINYFKPQYNSTFINSEIHLNQQVKELLKANGYTRIITEVNFDSDFWRFGSSVVKPKQHHAAVYKLDTQISV